MFCSSEAVRGGVCFPRVHAGTRNVDHVAKLGDILARLDAAGTIRDMDLPEFRLHPLKGELKGFWALTARANWRVVFRFAEGDALDVNYIDYD